MDSVLTRATGSAGPALTAGSSADRPRVPRRPVRWAVTLGCGAAAYAVAAAGLLPGSLVLLLASAAVVLAPTAPSLSRRLALNLGLVVGWSPLLWWRAWPVHVDHGAAVLALLAGATVGAALRPGGLRRLVPTARACDLLLPVSAAAAVVAMAPWVAAGSARRALLLMLPGVDNSAHLGMFAVLRAHGAVSTALPPPAGGRGWAFDNYPQGFHALAATLSELTSPVTPEADRLPVAYVHAVSLVVVLGVVMLASAALSLPQLARRPLVAVPAVALSLTAFLWLPGQDVLADGFANFWAAAIAAAVALLLALGSGARPDLAHTAAVVGLVVAVAYCWAPLVLLAVPALLVLHRPGAVLAAVRHRRVPRHAKAPLLVVVVGLVCVLRAFVALLSHVGIGSVVTATGGVHASSPLPGLVLVVASVAVLGRGPAWVRARGRVLEDESLTLDRIAVLVLVPVVGTLLLVGLLVVQLRETGTAAYYFVKLFLGLELTLAGVLPAVAAVLLVDLGLACGRRWVGVGVSLAAAAAATQVFGAFPASGGTLSAEGRDGTAAVGAPLDAERIVDGVLAAVADGDGRPAGDREYVALADARAGQAFYPDAWYHALTVSLSDRAATHMDLMHRKVDDLSEATSVVRLLLHSDEHVDVLVDPDDVGPLQASVGSRFLAERIHGWGGAVSGADR